jgi:hypothetical protein
MTRTTASCGSAERSGGRRTLAGTAAVVLMMVVLAGCSAATGDGGGQKAAGSKARPDERLRDAVSAGLKAAGRGGEADLVKAGGSRLTPVSAAFLRSWRIVQVDYLQGPHPVRFHVAVGASSAHLLTGQPEAFNKATAADGPDVSDAQTAAALARVYLTTTRPAGRLTYVVDGVDGIRWRPKLPPADARRRDEIVKKYGPVVKPPTAKPDGEGFSVVAYVVQNQELQRRTLTVASDGEVQEKTKSLVSDLPTPIAI